MIRILHIFWEECEFIDKKLETTIHSTMNSRPMEAADDRGRILNSNPDCRDDERLYFQNLIHHALRESGGNLKLQPSVITVVELLLEKGANVNSRDENGLTALHYAVDNRMALVIDFLISRGAKLFVRDRAGNSILHFLIEQEFRKLKIYNNFEEFNAPGVRQQSKDFVDWLVSKAHVYADSTNKKGETPLHLAAKYNLLHAIPILLTHTRDTTSTNVPGMTAFQVLAKCAVFDETDSQINLQIFTTTKIPLGNYGLAYVDRIVEQFLRKGYSVDVADETGNTPFHYALQQRKRNCAKRMLNYVKDVDLPGENGNTPLNIIMSYGQENSEEARKNDEIIVQVLLDRGADVNKVNRYGCSPLVTAVCNRKFGMLRMFMSYGANFQHTSNGKNLLHYFFSSKAPEWLDGYEAVFIMLVNQKCDVNAKDKNGMTPLHFAAQSGRIQIVQRLLNCKVDINSAESSRAYTPLHMSALQGHNEVVNLLIKHGADVNARTTKNQTALHLVKNGSAIVIEELIKNGAYIDVKDSDGYLPVQVAMIRRDEKVVKDLLRFGADVNDNPSRLSVSRYSCLPEYAHQHLEKLNLAGMYIDAALELHLGSITNWPHFYRTCLKEVESLKSYKISDSKSLYDLLHMNRNVTCAYVKNEKLRELIFSMTFEERFPMYHLLISSTYYAAIARQKWLEPARCVLNEITKIQWPDLGSDKLLAYLSNMDLRIMSDCQT